MNMLYILKNKRKKGYGKYIAEYWENKMQLLGYKTVMTSTQSNEYSQHFYVKLGYRTIGGFLLDKEAYEIILAKNLNNK